MSRTIKAIERHIVLPVRPAPPNGGKELVVEWQQRGPETLSGYTMRKLRLALSPTQSVVAASAAG